MDETQLASQQDSLRTVRAFVGALSGGLAAYTGDQTYLGYDRYAVNYPGGYQTIGPYGYSYEGTPISVTRSGGLAISPLIVWLGIGAAAVLLLKGR